MSRSLFKNAKIEGVQENGSEHARTCTIIGPGLGGLFGVSEAAAFQVVVLIWAERRHLGGSSAGWKPGLRPKLGHYRISGALPATQVLWYASCISIRKGQSKPAKSRCELSITDGAKEGI